MDIIWRVILTFTIFIVFATFHEYAHGWMANRLGDSTAERSGRLTLNPLAHIDLMWTIIIPATILISTGGQYALGSAKPVPVNPLWLRNPKRDMIWVGLAGPATNVAFIVILIALIKISIRTGIVIVSLNPRYCIPESASPICLLLFMCMSINIVLLVFNLLPIPPLDGSRVLEGLLPDRYAEQYSGLGRYGFIILMGLMLLGVLHRLLVFVLMSVVETFSIPYPQIFLQ